MKLSPIQLAAYALTELSYRANDAHKPADAVAYTESDLEVATTCSPDASNPHRRSMTLRLTMQPRTEANAPYYVTLQIVGVIESAPDLESDNPDLLIRVNGASLLYGVAREVVRQVTSIGPFPPLLIPSVSFRPDAAVADKG